LLQGHRGVNGTNRIAGFAGGTGVTCARWHAVTAWRIARSEQGKCPVPGNAESAAVAVLMSLMQKILEKSEHLQIYSN